MRTLKVLFRKTTWCCVVSRICIYSVLTQVNWAGIWQSTLENFFVNSNVRANIFRNHLKIYPATPWHISCVEEGWLLCKKNTIRSSPTCSCQIATSHWSSTPPPSSSPPPPTTPPLSWSSSSRATLLVAWAAIDSSTLVQISCRLRWTRKLFR